MSDLVMKEMPDEVLLYDLKQHKAHCLNQAAALVWRYCQKNALMAAHRSEGSGSCLKKRAVT